MQRLTYVLFQIDEACRYIAGGRMEQLRIALLLLDNAAEIQMDRRISAEMGIERLRERTLEMARRLEDAGGPPVDSTGDWTPLSREEKKRIERTFDGKVDYLVDRAGIIDGRVGALLKYIHRYRNEAYHDAHIRPETIRTAAIILLELNCLLLLNVRPGSMVLTRHEGWLEERFGLDTWEFSLSGNGVEVAVEEFRRDLASTPEDVATALADHLSSRFTELIELLDYAAGVVSSDDADQAFRIAQYEHAARRGAVELTEAAFEKFAPEFRVSDIHELRGAVDGIRKNGDSLDAFRGFAVIEDLLESFEEPVYALVSEVDDLINSEIDRLRGK